MLAAECAGRGRGRMETTDGDRCVSKLVGFGAAGELRLCHETASSPYTKFMSFLA